MNENGEKKRIIEDVKQLYRHADIANREMGIVQTDIKWMKSKLKNLDAKVWGILVSVIIGILVQIYLK